VTFSDVWHAYESLFLMVGPVLLVGIALMGVRMSSYWWSFLLFWNRYRERTRVTTDQLLETNVPNIKIQITTRGSEAVAKLSCVGYATSWI
jgi:hypothetical protein